MKLRSHKPVCVLTNGSVYSAANAFAVWTHTLPLVRLVGDHTGGGSGMPMSNSLPNGWSVRYSACPMYDDQQHHIEFGIAPDKSVSIGTSATVDNIIEAACTILTK